MVRLENLSKNYGTVKAVKSISFELSDSQIVGFLGANGAGKSTTLKMMTGFISPTSGNVFVDDLNIIDHNLEIQKQIGYLPELNPLYNEMKVYDYLNFHAATRGIKGQDFKSALTKVVKDCGLKGIVHKTVGTCSKGYKQRLGLAAAMIHNPKILILDEPVTGLDPNQIVEVRELIKTYLNVEWIQSVLIQNIYNQIYMHLSSESIVEPEIIMNELKDDLSRNLMAELIFDELEVNKTMAIDCLIRIEQSMIQTQLNNLREKLKTNDSMELVQKITELQKNRNDVKKKYLDV